MVSAFHKKMTKAVLAFARDRYMGPNDQNWSIKMDICPGQDTSPLIKGHRPDLHTQNKNAKITIIGEAKTDDGLMILRTFVILPGLCLLIQRF